MEFSYARIRNTLYNKFKKEKWFEEVSSYTVRRYHPIETRMIETFRYVDCDPMNYDVFSYEYASILRDSGSVFSSIMDRLVRETISEQRKKEYDIRDYRKWLKNEIENIHLVSVGINYEIQRRFLLPFDGLQSEKGKLEWWNGYTNIKHSDINKFKDGNLGNSFLSLGALAILYALVDMDNGSHIRLFDEIGFFEPRSSLEQLLFIKPYKKE